MRKFPFPLLLFIGFLVFSIAMAQDKPSKELLAQGDGIQISRAEVERMAAGRLESLELERIRFEADQRKKHHNIYEDTLTQLIKNRVMALEAESLGITVKELTDKEVSSKIVDPTDEDVDKFYKTNQKRLRRGLCSDPGQE